MKLVKDFRVISIPLNGGGVHYLYIKQHKANSGDKSDGKTLFVGNVDYGRILTNEEINSLLRSIFSGFGDIQSILVNDVTDADYSQLPSRFSHITFEEKSSLRSCLKASDEVYDSVCQDTSRKFGLEEKCQPKTGKEIIKKNLMYDTDLNELKAYVEKHMTEFDEKEQIYVLERKKRSLQADEDGFILVTNQKRKKRKVTSKRGHGEQRERRKKKKYELNNFYRFQMREEKRQKLVDLRKKFEEDKLKVAKMKEGRKLKPF